VLVRFDSTKLEWDLVKLEKERALDKSELESLVSATLPMELQEIEHDLVESRGLLEAERQYLNDSITLSKENLISRQEVDKQRMKVKGLESKADQIAQRLHLTKTHLHPAKLERARAKLNSDELSLEIARKQLESSIVRAPADGIVVYKPLSVGGEFRTVRVGDTVFPNQPFMVLPDMQDLVVHCDVPESELARVEPGAKALVRALAYPDKTYNGQVTSISSVAQTLPGYPAWQKFFHVTIGLESADARIRPGMSVTAHVLSFYRKDATLIPRRAVSWEGNRAVSRVLVGGDYQPREISVGAANDMYYEVLAGVALGDKVALQ